jgi:hypothetical protein
MILSLYVLIMLHSPDGVALQISPDHVTTLTSERPNKEQRLYTKGAKCLISLTDGQKLAVIEDCDTVRRLLDDSRQNK